MCVSAGELVEIMPRLIQTKVARKPAHEIKSARFIIWGFIVAACFWIGLGIYNELREAYWDSQYIKLGHAVDCRTRPNPNYLAKFCDIEADGDSCADESRNRLQRWHEPIDYACAQYEPDRTFRFPAYREPETLEVAEVSG